MPLISFDVTQNRVRPITPMLAHSSCFLFSGCLSPSEFWLKHMAFQKSLWLHQGRKPASAFDLQTCQQINALIGLWVRSYQRCFCCTPDNSKKERGLSESSCWLQLPGLLNRLKDTAFVCSRRASASGAASWHGSTANKKACGLQFSSQQAPVAEPWMRGWSHDVASRRLTEITMQASDETKAQVQVCVSSLLHAFWTQPSCSLSRHWARLQDSAQESRDPSSAWSARQELLIRADVLHLPGNGSQRISAIEPIIPAHIEHVLEQHFVLVAHRLWEEGYRFHDEQLEFKDYLSRHVHVYLYLKLR